MKIAACLFSFARYDELDQTLTSLENQRDAPKDIDWFFIQDGLEEHPDRKSYNRIKFESVERCVKRLHSSSLDHVLIRNPINRSINYQVNQAFNILDGGLYDALFLFENDLVVSPYYLRLLNLCAEQYPDIVAGLHSVNPNPEVTEKNLKQLIRSKKPRCWGIYITLNAWKMFRHVWYDRYDSEQRSPFYDTIITQAVKEHTKGKFVAMIPRAINIGRQGTLSTNKTSWTHRNLHLQAYDYVYPYDAKLDRFILNS